jgi:hypothetical protein
MKARVRKHTLAAHVSSRLAVKVALRGLARGGKLQRLQPFRC